MIDIKEIRIGNIIRDGKDSFHSITDADIYDEIGSSEVFKYYNPIPLTPEILEACGSLSPYVISKYSKEYYSLFFDSVAACNVVGEVELKSLHQLQNLYFALTGEELMISETALKRSVATTAK